MTQKINLKALERKAWTSNFQDGIADIGIGLMFVLASICMIFSDIRFYLYLLYLIPVLLIVLAKKFITIPRMGFVKYSRERNRKRYILYSVMTISIVIFLLITVLAKKSLFPGVTSGAVVVSTIVFIICISIAFFLNFNRMYVYAFLITASFILSEIIIAKTGVISSGGYAYLIPSVVMIALGIVYLYKFLRKYPLPAEGVENDEN
ncbi:hypothetical protein AMJ80_10820 [bacterium SM23_31]|nr:MAG: hypothetical protein AMJ80_10820 [bacterium SM23_31]